MNKEHKNFTKSYAAHLNSKEKYDKSNRSEESMNRIEKADEVEAQTIPPFINPAGQDLPVDLQSDQEPPSFRIIRKFDKPIESVITRRRPTTSTVTNKKAHHFTTAYSNTPNATGPFPYADYVRNEPMSRGTQILLRNSSAK